MRWINVLYAPIIVLLAHPRSLSTAFERVIRERGDVTVIHEPFTYLYYLKRWPDSPDTLSFPKEFPKSFKAMCEWIESIDGPVFIKDMGFALEGSELPEDFQVVLIHRDPKDALPSLYKLEPECSEEFLGYDALVPLADRAKMIISAEAFAAKPHAVMKQFCTIFSLPQAEDALEFSQEPSSDWKGRWYRDVRIHKRIVPIKKHSWEEIPLKDRPKWLRYYCSCRKAHEVLQAQTPTFDHLD